MVPWAGWRKSFLVHSVSEAAEQNSNTFRRLKVKIRTLMSFNSFSHSCIVFG